MRMRPGRGMRGPQRIGAGRFNNPPLLPMGEGEFHDDMALALGIATQGRVGQNAVETS